MAYQALEKLHRIHDGFIEAYRVGAMDILLIQWQSKLYAYQNHCPHQGAPLTYGSLHDGAIRCPLHGLEYRLEDGEPITGNTGPLQPINLVYEGNTVGIEI